MDKKVCALASCGQEMKPGLPPYKIAGHHEEYCSRKCVDIAASPAPASKGKKVTKPAEDFGTSGVVRNFCDLCQSPITLAWKTNKADSSLEGKVFCSNGCLTKAEDNPETLTKIQPEETTMATATSPITAGTTPTPKAPKKSAKKAAMKAAKKAPTKKAPVKAAKKAAKAPKAAKGTDLFRPGTTKAKVWDYLKGGAKRKRENVKELLEGHAIQILNHVLTDARAAGFKITADKESIQVAV